ncbi:MAG: GtrA family protein [Nanoarchaeota archaeon]|nr:GtrA family protein [Nanoarchaeota archaeon]MBU1027549.1 GtrA family protein [Nanoarchaeota archaeon]
MLKKIKRFLDKTTSLNGKASNILTRLIRYSLTGLSSGTVDLTLLIILVEIFKVYYLIAATISFIATHSSAYFINRKWGFKDSKSSTSTGYYFFITFGIIGIILTLYLLKFGVETLKINYILARIIVGITVGIFNFSMNFFITFRMKIFNPKKTK